MSRLRRLPISARLAGAYAALFLVLVAGVAAVVYVQLGAALRAGIDANLVDAAATVTERLDGGEVDFRGERAAVAGLEAADRATQLVAADGTVIESSGDLPPGRPLLTADQLAQVRAGLPVRDTTREGEHQLRILAVPVTTAPGVAVAVVGADLESVSDAQGALLTVLAPAAAAAALLAAALGWVVARAGLAPIDRMTREAAGINAGALHRRLPVPDTGDEVARLARTLNAMLERLAAAIGRERAFTADASHELRTPLAILRTEAELARRRTREARTGAALDSILEEADRLGALVEDLLVLARADADRMDSRERVDLGDLAAAVTGRFAGLADARGVTLTGQGAATIGGDRRALDRALSNLVDNAVRHTPPGGTVTLSVALGSAGVEVSVADTGPGVAPDLLPLLFERFTTADAARTSGGAGLGLAIVAAVAAAHGGTTQAANQAGGGLAVTLRLP